MREENRSLKTGIMCLLSLILALISPIGLCFAAEAEPKSESGAKIFALDSRLVDFGLAYKAGKDYLASFKLKNIQAKGAEPAQFSVEACVGEEAMKKCSIALSKEEEKYFDANEWLDLARHKQSFSLAPGEEREVKLRLSVPEKAAMGQSHYARFIVTSDTQSEEMIARINLDGKDAHYAANLKRAEVPLFAFNGQYQPDILLANEGNYGYPVKIEMRRSPAFGIEEWTEVFKGEYESIPGMQLSLQSSNGAVSGAYALTEARDAVDVLPGFGVQKLEYKISFVNDQGSLETVTRTRRIVSFGLLQLVILLAAVALIVFAILTFAKK